jgi:predicted secreted protein
LTDSGGTAMKGLDDLFTVFNNRTAINWQLATGAFDASPKFTGSGLITSLSMDAPMEDVTTFSGSIAVTGAVSFSES